MFDYVLRVAMKRIPERTLWPILGNTLLALLGYADDIVLISRTMAALRARMHTVENTCTD